MKILYLATQVRLDTHEASYNHTFGIAQNLQLIKGNEIVLIISGDKTRVSKMLGMIIYEIPFRSLIDNVSFLRKLWRSFFNNVTIFYKLLMLTKTGTDIVYERHSVGSMAGIWLSIILRKPLVFEVNGIPDEEIVLDLGVQNHLVKKILFKITKIQIKRASAVIVQTLELREIIMKRYKIDNVYVVENGANIMTFKKRKIKRESFELSFIGTLDDMHELTSILQAMALIESNFTLNIIGDGKLKPLYERKYKNDKRFKFHGRLKHKKAMGILNKTDLSIAIYSNDYPLFQKYGFYLCPLKIFEYISHGVPCVYIGPKNSLITKLEKNGSLITMKSSQNFRNTIQQIIDDNTFYSKLINSALECRKEYTWEQSAIKTSRILNELLS